MYWDFSPRLIGFQVLPPSSVRKAPAAEMAMNMRLGLLWIEKDGVQSHAAGAGLPLRSGAVAAQAGQLMPGLAAIGGAEQGGVLHAGVDDVGIAQRRLQMPDALELPGMLRAVVPLVRRERLAAFPEKYRRRTCCSRPWACRRGAVVGSPGGVPGWCQVLPPSSERWMTCPNQPLVCDAYSRFGSTGEPFRWIDLPAGEEGAADVPPLVACRPMSG